MPHAFWKGSISFGRVEIGVALRPLNFTCVAPAKSKPLIVTVVPGAPTLGEKP